MKFIYCFILSYSVLVLTTTGRHLFTGAKIWKSSVCSTGFGFINKLGGF